MIDGLELHGFKRFEHLELELKRITLLTGSNGAGKSSVIQSILLAHIASDRSQDVRLVPLNGNHCLELGEAEDVICRSSSTPDQFSLRLRSDGVESVWIFRRLQADRSQHFHVSRPIDPPGPLGVHGADFSYLCAERLGPRDCLVTGASRESELSVGPKGEFVAHVLATHNRPLPSDRLLEGNSLLSLRDQTEAWLSHIVRPIQLQAIWHPSSLTTQLRYKVPGITGDWTRPQNMGFGVSYALPIIVAGLLCPQGGLLLVENPEAHLHPMGQSRFGQFLVKMASSGVQVIVETHSDHVLHGVRRALASGLTELTPAEGIVHFFHNNDDLSQVSSIGLTPDGGLITWPKGFFDQLEDDLGALAAIRRQRAGPK